MSDVIRIISLGGLDEDGKNCIAIDISGDLFIVGCGVRYPDRTLPGIDYVIPNYDYLVARKNDIKAYFLLQGDEDDMAALTWIYPYAPAPVYAASFTIELLKAFAKNQGKDETVFDFHEVPPSSSFKVANRKITYFHTAHNIADSSGMAIATDLGNIVISGDFVVENNAKAGFQQDLATLAKLAEEPTLVVLCESKYADHPGYTAPNYKLTPLVERDVKDAKGRVFFAVFASNPYCISEVIALAMASRKKIIPYDQETSDVLKSLSYLSSLQIPRMNYAPLDDIHRLKDSDEIILMVGMGAKLYNKIGLLASRQNEDKRVFLTPEDLFIVACPANDNTEIEFTDSVDELYRTGAQVRNLTRKQLRKMHASEEDIKMLLSLLKPKYYIPVKGFFKDLLNNAEVALSMGIKLNHSNVFLPENGLTVLIDEKGAKMINENIPHGDIMIDGIGIGDVGEKVLHDREKLGEGVVVLALTISKSKRKIVAAPDVQMRGFIYVKDAESIIKEVSRIFVTTVEECLSEDEHYSIENIKQTVYEKCLRSIRRSTGKEPMVLPLLIELP